MWYLQRALRLGCFSLLLAGFTLVCSYRAYSADLQVVNLDGSVEGFNDPSEPDGASTAGGNDGTTLGEQRLIAFQYAADTWAKLISSPVAIRIGANFDALDCDDVSAILGAAGPTTVHANFAGAPVQNTWYSQALANSLAAMDLAPDHDDIGAVFNSSIGTTCPFPTIWYYGLDGNPPEGTIDFVTVVLHELAHGLGFLSLVDDFTGEKLFGLNDVFTRKVEDHKAQVRFPQMTNLQRLKAIISGGNLHWVGSQAVAASDVLTGGAHASGHVELYAPNPVEPGASVSHFDVDLTPDELMEPFYTGPKQDVGLTLELLRDIGWRLATPAAVTDLAVVTSTATSIDLAWTAPGNDGNDGTPLVYDVRYATSKLRIKNWSRTIAAASEPPPSSAGSLESMTVAGLLCGKTYFFALRALSHANSRSKRSNIAKGATTACP